MTVMVRNPTSEPLTESYDDDEQWESENEQGGNDGYDFSKHAQLKEQLELFYENEGKVGLEWCDRSNSNFVGLANQGATCYLNSLLQTLFFTKEFRKRIYEWDFQKQSKKNEAAESCIPLQLQLLFARLEQAEQIAVSTKGLTKSFGWTGVEAFEQQDVQELCRVLFDSLEHYQDGKDFTQPFKGSLVDYLKCLKCEHRRAKREEFQDISLVVKDSSTVSEALEKFVEVEKLERDNQYFCEHCDCKVDAIKGHRLLGLPKVLVLHLKRFIFNWEIERRIKLQETMEIPLTLDVRDYVGFVDEPHGVSSHPTEPNADFPSGEDPSHLEDSMTDSLRDALSDAERSSPSNDDTIYELDAILVHSGNAMSGHYFSIVKTSDDTWHEFNDISVTRFTKQQVSRMCSAGGSLAEGGAYMLMYSLKSDKVRHTSPPKAIVEAIRRENEQRKMLKKVEKMEKSLVRFDAFLGPTTLRNPDSKRLEQVNLPSTSRKDTTIELHGKKATIVDAKHTVYQKLIPKHLQTSLPLARCRLRKAHGNSNTLGEPFTEEEQNSPLCELGLSPHEPLVLEFLRPGQTYFPKHCADTNQIRIFIWNSVLRTPQPASCCFEYPDAVFETDSKRSLESSLPPILVNGDITVHAIQAGITTQLGIPVENQRLFCLNKLTRIGACGKVGDLIPVDNKDMNLQETHGFHSGDGVILVCGSEDQVDEMATRVQEEHLESKTFIQVFFNDPRQSPGGPVEYEYSIKINKETTLEELKKRMVGTLEGGELDSSLFHLRRSAKSQQIKDESQTLDAINLVDQAVMHIGNGKPIPMGKVALRFFVDKGDEFTFAFKLVVGELDKIESVRETIAEKLDVATPSLVRLLDRTGKTKTGCVYRDGASIRSSIKRLQDGRNVVIQLLEKEEAMSTSNILITVVKLKLGDNNELCVENKCEEVVEKTWTMEQLAEKFENQSLGHVTVLEQKKNKSGQILTSSIKWFHPSDNSDKLSKQVISLFPIRISDGSLVICAQRKDIEDDRIIELGACPEQKTIAPKRINRRKSSFQREGGGVSIGSKPPSRENEENTSAVEAPPKAADKMQRVPSLDFSAISSSQTSYQEEFLEKQEEFSKSWREGVKLMQSRGQPEVAPSENTEQHEEKKRKKNKKKKRPESSQSSKASSSKGSSSRSSKTSRSRPGLQPGQRVLAKAEHWKRFFPGTIFSFNEDSKTYSIDFDDGDRLESVETFRIRPLEAKTGSKAELEAPMSPVEPPIDPTMSPNSQGAKGEIVIAGLPDNEDLCPTDKKARRKEKIESRDLRLQLMFMDDNENGEHERPVKVDQEFLDAQAIPRVNSSPTHSQSRAYLDEEIRPRRSLSSKAHRTKTSQVLDPLPQNIRASTVPGRLRGTNTNVADELLTTKPKTKVKKTLEPIGVQKPSYQHQGRRIYDSRKKEQVKTRDTDQYVPGKRSSTPSKPLPPI